MNTIPAKELKRRGVAAIEELIDDGPVEVIKNNRPACVVLSMEQYMSIIKPKPVKHHSEKKSVSELFSMPASGKCKKNTIDARLKSERESWGKS